eukprot:8242027-Pyramimonas_sp.AAC.1
MVGWTVWGCTHSAIGCCNCHGASAAQPALKLLKQFFVQSGVSLSKTSCRNLERAARPANRG